MSSGGPGTGQLSISRTRPGCGRLTEVTDIAGQSLVRVTIEIWGYLLGGWEGGLFTSEVTSLL